MRTFCKNAYIINDTESFSQHLANLLPLQNGEEDVSYDVELLVANIPVLQTIDYIMELNYVYNKIKPICSKLVVKRLPVELVTEC